MLKGLYLTSGIAYLALQGDIFSLYCRKGLFPLYLLHLHFLFDIGCLSLKLFLQLFDPNLQTFHFRFGRRLLPAWPHLLKQFPALYLMQLCSFETLNMRTSSPSFLLARQGLQTSQTPPQQIGSCPWELFRKGLHAQHQQGERFLHLVLM